MEAGARLLVCISVTNGTAGEGCSCYFRGTTLWLVTPRRISVLCACCQSVRQSRIVMAVEGCRATSVWLQFTYLESFIHSGKQMRSLTSAAHKSVVFSCSPIDVETSECTVRPGNKSWSSNIEVENHSESEILTHTRLSDYPQSTVTSFQPSCFW